MEKQDNFKLLLALLCTIEWLANDLHYRSTGQGFYEKHLLADRIRDFGDAEDQLKEAYYLGFKGIFPPVDKDIVHLAVMIYDKMKGASSIETRQLAGAFSLLSAVVEECKKENSLPAGIHAILDSISEKSQTYSFLVRAESCGLTEPVPTDPDPIATDLAMDGALVPQQI